MALTREQFQQLRNKGLSVDQIVKFESGETPGQTINKFTTAQKLGDVLTGASKKGFFEKRYKPTVDLFKGIGKGALSTLRGASSLGEKVLQAPLKAVGVEFDEQTGAEKLISEDLTEAKGTFQKIGKFGEQVAEFAVPVTKVAKATKTLSTIKQILSKAATSGSVATAQEGKVGRETAIAAGVEAAFPVVGRAIKPVVNVVKRLFTGLGSGLSGVPLEQLSAIARNPKVARDISQVIKKEGQEAVLEKNAKEIVNGISKIRQQARNAYREGVEVLSKTDIKPNVIKSNILDVLENNFIKLKPAGGIDLGASEILNKQIQKKAEALLLQLNNNTPIDGKSLRSFMSKLESSKFKSALDPDRQAFNNLMNDLSSGLKKSIKDSTTKLDDIDKKFSQEMSLAEGMESIFGKIKFKNTKELNRVAKKLESLFSQKGLDPKTVDSFLTRIGITPEDFKTAEAVRGVVTKTSGANTKGLSFAEILQSFTSAVVTPEAVKNIAVATGVSTRVLNAIISATEPSVRGAIIKALINNEE
jgi:hypothetical protein